MSLPPSGSPSINRTREATVARDLNRLLVALDPTRAKAHFDLGNAFYLADEPDAALAAFLRSARLNPRDPAPLTNAGLILQEAGDLDGAIDAHREATVVGPDFAPAHYNLAACLLRAGRWREAWPEFDWRSRCVNINAGAPDPSAPIWDGTSLGGGTLLVHEEGGFGDTVNFLPLARGLPGVGRVVAHVRRPLARLVATADFIDEVSILGESAPPHDARVSTQGLLGLRNTDPDDLGRPEAYLSIPFEAGRRWAPLVPRTGRLRVGVAWTGNPALGAAVRPGYAASRGLDLDRLTSLFEIDGIDWYSLQVGPAAADLRGCHGTRVRDLTDEIEDFADTAALIERLDLVVSVDTAVVHVAGALGRPTWVLSRFDSCWRWPRDRETAPWYPRVRVFRQERPGDWDGVLARVRSRLIAATNGNPL